MLARAARPKLSLAVPALSINTSTPAAAKANHLPRTPISPSPISPTARNTRLNQQQHSFATLQPSPPTFAKSSQASSCITTGILKKGVAVRDATKGTSKRLQFREEAEVRCVTPVPQEYHGTYIKMTREERRWGM